MTQRAFVDANIILRFLTGEPPQMAESARALFLRADQGALRLVVDEITVAEVVWVLESFYRHPREIIAQTLQSLLAHEAIEMAYKEDVLLALTFYAGKNVDFADALVAVHMYRQGITDIFSFDRHFDRFPHIRRLSPENFTNAR